MKIVILSQVLGTVLWYASYQRKNLLISQEYCCTRKYNLGLFYTKFLNMKVLQLVINVTDVIRSSLPRRLLVPTPLNEALLVATDIFFDKTVWNMVRKAV